MEPQQQQQQQQPSSNSFYSFLRHDLPKVELHAHLNGCIPLPLLQQLAAERGVVLSSKYFRAPSSHNKNAPQHSHQPPDMYNLHPRSLQDCFAMFAELPAIVNDLTAVRQITEAALEEFAQHHVAYLELRSTPKRLQRDFRLGGQSGNSNDDMMTATKQDYVETILQVMRDFQERERVRYEREQRMMMEEEQQPQQPDSDSNGNGNYHQRMPRLPLVGRFIVSVDRAQTLEEATENIDLAIRLHQESDSLVVGVDLGGNPTQKVFNTFRPLFQKARKAGLGVTIHCAELPCDDGTPAYDEAAAILQFRPDRLGHAVLLPAALLRELDVLQIPVETCPTSNIMTLELHHQSDDDEEDDGDATGDDRRSRHGNLVHGLQQHASLRHWLAASCSRRNSNSADEDWHHPIAVATDDPGVFDTNATQELWLLATALDWNHQQLGRLVTHSVGYAFCDVATRKRVRERVRQRVEALRVSREASSMHG